MFAKQIMKNPVLMIGILFFVLFLFTLRDKGYLSSRGRKLKATSCDSILVMLNKRVSDNWKLSCDNNNLFVSIKSELLSMQFKKRIEYRAAIYRNMANSLMFISKNSPNDGLGRVFIIRLEIASNKLVINAITEGKYLAQMATLKSSKGIAEHLKATVQVSEKSKF